MRKIHSILIGLAVTLALAPPARAEQKYTLGFTSDFLGGIGNQSGSGGSNAGRVLTGTPPFFALYPSLTLKAVGAHSNFNIAYGFTMDHYWSDPEALTTTYHALTLNLDTRIGRRTSLKFSNSLRNTPDVSMLNVLKGFVFTPDGFQSIYEPMLFKNHSYSELSRLSMDVEVTRKSFLTFAVDGTIRRYGNIAVDETWTFQDQTRIGGTISYSRKSGKRGSFGVNYKIYQNDYRDYGPTRSHALQFHASRELAPSLMFTFEAGPSLTEKNQYLPEDRISINFSASLSKKLNTSLLSMHFSKSSGDSSGMGYARDSYQAGLGFSRPFGPRTSLNVDVSAFQQKGQSFYNQDKQVPAYDYWGLSGSAVLSRKLSRLWTLSFGGNYQDFKGQKAVSMNHMSYKRLYVSLSFQLPELWRAAR